MSDIHWQGNGTDFSIVIGGQRWRLKVDDPRPGLSGPECRLLGLHYVSIAGHHDDQAFDGTSLLACESHHDHIQATYAPRTRPGLSVRATWSPTPDRDGFDLEVQVAVGSGAELRRLEVAIESVWPTKPRSPHSGLTYGVSARDAGGTPWLSDPNQSPSLSGPDTTIPLLSTSLDAFPPLVRLDPSDGRNYVEMVAPNDCARRIIAEAPWPGTGGRRLTSVRYALFGHDLEKGVVVRGRVRGMWLTTMATPDELRELYEAFLGQPPPLGP